MASLFRWNYTTVCTALLIALPAVSGGCSTSTRESGDVVGSTGGGAGQSAGVGQGGQATREGSAGAGIGGRVSSSAGGMTSSGGRTSAGGGDASGGIPGSGGGIAPGGAPNVGGALGSGGTTGTGGGAGVGGDIAAGGTTSGVGGHIANAGATGSGGDSAPGGEAGTAGISGSAGSSAGGGDSECVPAPGPCTRTTYYSGTDPTSTTTYFYDDLDQLIRMEVDGASPDIIRLTYDDAGRLIERRSEGCGTNSPDYALCQWTTYTYDEQGNLLVEDRSRSAYLLIAPGCTRYTYDENGLRLTASFYEWCGGDVVEYTTYEYDADGRLVVTHQFGRDPTGPSADITLEYDAAGEVVTETRTDTEGNVTLIIRYARDATGRVVVTTYEFPDRADYQTTYTYDELGNQLSQSTLSLEGETEGEESDCYVFTYDDCGNELTFVVSQECNDEADRTGTLTYDCFVE